MTLADLIDSFRMHAKYKDGMSITRAPAEPLPRGRAVVVGGGPKFEPVAPLKDYVPEWKRKKMADDLKLKEYADRLQDSPLTQGLTTYTNY